MKTSVIIVVVFYFSLILFTHILQAQPVFKSYSQNPVLNKGAGGEWDAISILPKVFPTDSLIYIFYTGTDQFPITNPLSIGLAYSSDGYNYTKYASNPILTGDGSGFDSVSATTGAVLMDGDSLVLFYNGSGIHNGEGIGRATAKEPSGPWIRGSKPVLSNGSSGEWDEGFIDVYTVLKNGNVYIMFYSGGDVPPPGTHRYMIGMATSTDGINWTKYNDPSTTTAPYAESDPVLKPGSSGAWDDYAVWQPSVIKTGNGYEMFYLGSSTNSTQIGFAKSSNGINWTKSVNNPIYDKNNDPHAAGSGSLIESPAVVVRNDSYFMYYDYGLQAGEIGLATAPLNSMIINVPDDYPTIQAGINAAVNGNTVLIAEGTYYENINFKGKAITVASQFYLDQDTSHISKTIINGSKPSDPNKASVVTFDSGEDTTSVIMGFTITGGSGTVNIKNNRLGGGIYCYLSSARIGHNIIENNKIVTSRSQRGAGICGYNSTAMYIIIENNTIKNNYCQAKDNIAMGGGVYLECSGRIVNNKIIDNEVEYSGISQVYGGYGGGVSFGWWGSGYLPVKIYGNTIANNIVSSNNLNACGGGIDLIYANCDFKGNIIKDNQVSGDPWAYGGGMRILASTGTVADNIFTNNSSLETLDSLSGGGLVIAQAEDLIIEKNSFKNNESSIGAGLTVVESSAKIINNIIAFNKASLGGGGLFSAQSTNCELINNTIVKNIADFGGGIIFVSNSNPVIMNTIIYGNKADTSGSQLYFTDTVSHPVIRYCDIEGGIDAFGFDVAGGIYNGTYSNNIENDPLFADDSLFYLSDSSPCISRGIDSIEIANVWYKAPLFCFGGNPRPSPSGSLPDIGAYESLMGNPVGVKQESANPTEFVLKQNYPNPFNPTTTIRYSIPENVKRQMSDVKLVIYDILGREIAVLVNEEQKPGYYEVKWNAGEFSSGIYFYRITAGSYAETKKMILLR